MDLRFPGLSLQDIRNGTQLPNFDDLCVFVILSYFSGRGGIIACLSHGKRGWV